MKRRVMVIGLLVLMLVAGYSAVSFYAVTFVHSRLETIVRSGAFVSEVTTGLTHVSLKNIRYEDPQTKRKLLEIKEMRIYPSLLSFLKGSLGIRECKLIEPTIFIYRTPQGLILAPWPSGDRGQEHKKREKETTDQKEGRLSRVQIRRFQVETGSVDVVDQKTGGSPAPLRWNALNLELRDLEYPVVSRRCALVLNGRMKGKTREGRISSEGWVDLKTFDLETVLNAEGMEVKTFEPYYQKRVSAEIEFGLMDLRARISVKERNVDASGELELTDFRVKDGEGTVFWIPAKTLVSLLKERGHRIKIKFRVKGDLADPKFNFQEKLATRIALSLAESLSIPVKQVEGEVSGGR